MVSSACPSDERVAALLEGALDPLEREELVSHVESCDACRRALSAADDTRHVLATGDRLGRYVIRGELGAGASCVVYRAYDALLDRDVALKVLRPDTASFLELRVRLEREARCIAKLSHPNVVAVHDVGEDAGRLFLALELVDGGTLREWLREPRPLRARVEAFLQAADGLAAAHGAGLVHRDFKPDNVLVGRDGRVRVTDFGLVRRALDPSGPEARAPVALGASHATQLTMTGAIVGTPAYLAPELRAGGDATPAADQFAFAVALAEAITGERPVGAATQSVVARLPRWLAPVLARSLAAEPAARHPSVAALAGAIRRRAPWSKSRLPVVIATGVTLALAGSLVVVLGRRDRCDELAGAQLAWGREAVERAFVTADPARGAATFAQVAGAIGRFERDLGVARVAACRAPEPKHRELRAACLDDKASFVTAITTELRVADARVVARAPEVVARLPDLSTCAMVEALARRSGRIGRASREDAAAVDAELRKTLAQAGLYPMEQTVPRLEQVERRAAAIGYPRGEAMAIVQRTSELSPRSQIERTRRDLARAAALAIDAADDELLADVFLTLLDGEAYVPGHPFAGTASEVAGAYIRRLGDDDREGRRQYLLAAAAYFDDLDLAVRHGEAARALWLRGHGPDHISVAAADTILGNAAFHATDWERALVHHERALAIRERALGPGARLTDMSRHNHAETLVELGREREAIVAMEQVIARQPSWSAMHHRIAHAARRLGDLALAETRDRLAIEACNGFGCELGWLGLAKDLELSGKDEEARRAIAGAMSGITALYPGERADVLFTAARIAKRLRDDAGAAALASRAAAEIRPLATRHGREHARTLAAIEALSASLARAGGDRVARQ